MKKKVIALSVATLILSVGTVAFASSNDENFGRRNFDEMLPRMQEMHPDFTESELEEMYNNCHGEGGMMRNRNGQGMRQNERMMNRNGERINQNSL
ncbi:MAG: hypothetical protein LRY71_01645 [Bacillaceae bacterium]|nr:hypothetical protein [Bacillaceae bacterium]